MGALKKFWRIIMQILEKKKKAINISPFQLIDQTKDIFPEQQFWDIGLYHSDCWPP